MTAYDAAVARQLVTDDVLHTAKDDLNHHIDALAADLRNRATTA